MLAEREIVEFTRELKPVAEKTSANAPDDHPSFFEFMTAMAFLQFARKQCDISVIEVGLGGRLDATNIVTPEVGVITSIGVDHCEFLGAELRLIAAEKAGIIKPGRPVVMGRMPVEAEEVIQRIAAERNARVISVGGTFGDEIAAYPHTNLEGDYQRWNAATATLVARELGAKWKADEATIRRGLAQVDWPGRWQRVRIGGRLAVLDASHNPEGAQVLESNLTHLGAETGRAPVVITGALGAIRARPLLETIARFAREIHLVVPQQARACSHAELEALIPPTFRGRVVRATVEGLFPSAETCTAGGPDDVIVVTGSIYLLGEIMTRLQPARGAGEGRLQDF
jgi:dihydrofolate synthase/folylpolyglutamate synthase